MPSHVVAEAARGTVKIPTAKPLEGAEAAQLLMRMRRSELRKHRALQAAVAVSKGRKR